MDYAHLKKNVFNKNLHQDGFHHQDEVTNLIVKLKTSNLRNCFSKKCTTNVDPADKILQQLQSLLTSD